MLRGVPGPGAQQDQGCLVGPKSLHRGRAGVAEEDGVDSFDDVGAHVEEVSLVLDGDEGAAGAVVHGDLEGFGQGAEGLDVALDAHVAEYEEGGHRGGLNGLSNSTRANVHRA